ncbi:MAG: bifunctional 2-polyprenyl-6-hydroxyphenol methylase/3-demethylubiquinol 3-O-methyltransferase UbiG [Desulfobacteraceae bacterium]|nr:bifunctional 2-polyprenyl-6-hydroxyphenol methylase/3-demethylubiquinol 3-O-methyltransferase UbiG [Desulfobacteraceae bacterium]
MAAARENIDPREIGRFSGQARYWWDKKGPLQALHDINPLRVGYIREYSGISGKQVLDVGCGGGILSEALAGAGGEVTGIDLSEPVLEAARAHARQSGLNIDYRRVSAETLARESPGRYDIVACMELLEHVPDPQAIVAACAALAKPGGDIFFSTINRTIRSCLLVILAAEYLLGIAEKGTHAFARFIRPDELAAWAEAEGLAVADCSGFMYMPFIRRAWLTRRCGMNYVMHLRKPV